MRKLRKPATVIFDKEAKTFLYIAIGTPKFADGKRYKKLLNEFVHYAVSKFKSDQRIAEISGIP